jgi:5-methylcytosine-specific restriction endonuclease McrA
MIRIKYTKELLETNVKDCYSFAELCRRLGLKPEGSNPKTLRKKMDEFGVDYSHFTGQAWNKNPNNPVYKGKYLPKLCEHSSLSSANVKELVYRLGLKENKCEICGITEWQGKPIICELHHINGDSTDNRIENLQILCPNCHSQTDNFRSRNRSKKVLSAQEKTLDVEAG